MLTALAALSMWMLSAAPPPREDPPAPPPARCIRYFSLDGEIKAEPLRKALVELGTADAPARIVAGPSVATCRPKLSFVALDVPAALAVKDVARALKKSCHGVDELVWTSFRGVDRTLPSIMGVTAQDCVIGMASDMRWFESAGDAKYFYFVPGKLDGAALAKQFQTLFGPFDAGEIGTLASESLTFALTEPVDAAALKRAMKAIGKLDGVRKVDGSGTTMKIDVEFDGLHASASPDGEAKVAGSEGARVVIAAVHSETTQPSFYAGAIADALAKEKLSLATK